ncbi:MAG: hypothetical protein RsTaC01_0421 [Candidatus Paraimprobicoccus trichonymphae]|uniref:Uncharacterized protein n=1 Tax=Candidatus Paraimprobicoccus trichonymphae TaxID=3033793 RepID=A0AA48HW99_9FIRM|nr:MAG: hypothetical protein RsTaC01_0421 [Candidatus Paraimprobicoccus trichonymphae]
MVLIHLLVGFLLSKISEEALVLIVPSVPGAISAVALGSGIYQIASKNASSKTGSIVSLTTGILATASSLVWGYFTYDNLFNFKSKIQYVFACSVAPVAVLTSGLTLIGRVVFIRLPPVQKQKHSVIYLLLSKIKNNYKKIYHNDRSFINIKLNVQNFSTRVIFTLSEICSLNLMI